MLLASGGFLPHSLTSGSVLDPVGKGPLISHYDPPPIHNFVHQIFGWIRAWSNLWFTVDDCDMCSRQSLIAIFGDLLQTTHRAHRHTVDAQRQLTKLLLSCTGVDYSCVVLQGSAQNRQLNLTVICTWQQPTIKLINRLRKKIVSWNRWIENVELRFACNIAVVAHLCNDVYVSPSVRLW